MPGFDFLLFDSDIEALCRVKGSVSYPLRLPALLVVVKPMVFCVECAFVHNVRSLVEGIGFSQVLNNFHVFTEIQLAGFDIC